MKTETLGVALPTAVEEFVLRIASGDWDGMATHLTPDVVYDASVPGWHYQLQGAAAVVDEYREEWSGKFRWTIVEQRVVRAEDDLVLAIEMHGAPVHEGLEPVVCRLANLFRLTGDRIAAHTYFCCGEWDPRTVAVIAAQAPHIDGGAR